MKRRTMLLISAAMLILAGCSSSKVTSSWKEPENSRNRINKILVVGLFDSQDKVVRAEMEKQLADELKANGINAVTAYNLYGPKYFQDLSEKEVLKKINGNNIDAVITINLVDKNKERQFVPGPRYGGAGYRYNPFLGGWVYKPYYMPYYKSGHFETNVNYNFETNLYSVADKKLIYSVETQSYDPSSISALANDYSKSVVKDIKKKNILTEM